MLIGGIIERASEIQIELLLIFVKQGVRRPRQRVWLIRDRSSEACLVKRRQRGRDSLVRHQGWPREPCENVAHHAPWSEELHRLRVVLREQNVGSEPQFLQR